jgi:putative transposase
MLVTTWPDDAPRGAIAAFCRTHNVSPSWFHKVRAESRASGAAAAMELRSTRPKNSPAETNAGMVKLALEARAELKRRGFDHGPLSVQAKLRRQGLTPPSRATLARIFARAGVVIPEPKKKPRSAYRRFVYPNPNGCWQIDATEWTLANGRKVVVFQLIDDHSRLALASLAASGETSEAAIRVVDLAISRHGVPQKFLSDNGAALNPTRRGHEGALVNHLVSFGVVAITGKPGKPTTQGKNERVHGTLLKYLNTHPIAATLEELQTQLDDFDTYYNTEREHQSLPRMTPQEAWNATAKATPPTPPAAPEQPTELVQRTVTGDGEITVLGTRFKIGKDYNGQQLQITYNATEIAIYDTSGTEILSHPRPPKGTHYVGNNKPRGFMANQTSTKS